MAPFSTFDKSPGTYIEEITLPGPLPQVSTSIAAFVGPALQGPLNQPTLLTSIKQFNAIFGSYIETPYRCYAAHAINGFFNEGGQQCYYVRVGNGVAAWLDLKDSATNAQNTLRVTALDEGAAGNSIKAAVAAASLASATAPTASTTLASAAAAKSNSVTVASATGFQPGDTVTLEHTATHENGVIVNINAAVITLAGNLVNAYPSGATFRIADLTAGTTSIRVDSVANFQPGSYVKISNTVVKDSFDVVRVVNPVTNVLTITNGLTSTYAMTGGKAVKVDSMEFTLTVESANAGTETFSNLAMDPRHSQYYASVVNSQAVTVGPPPQPDTTPPPLNLPIAVAATALAHGVDDTLSSLAPNAYQAGIDTLRKYDVDLLCVPDAVNSNFTTSQTQAVQAYMVAHCEQMQDRFAILDCAEPKASDITFSAVQAQRQALNSNNGYAALYFPWIGISSPFGSSNISVPPSGHTAGVYAQNDNTFDVAHAPANEPIRSALSVEALLSDSDQGPLNEQGINVIRSFPSQGILIWGARTISPPDMTAWRYVNVRRLLLYIEKTIREGTRFAVFQPNNITLWQQVKRLVTDFLNGLWVVGDLFGATADQAFRVRVDATLNTPDVVALGQMIAEITVVPTHPAEFVVFQVIQDPTGASLQESSAG